MAFGCTVVSTVTRLRCWLRAGFVRHPQALGQQQLQLVAEPLAPMAEVRALVREDVLEELFAGEELEMRVVDPALAHPLIGQPVNVLEQQQPFVAHRDRPPWFVRSMFLRSATNQQTS